MQTQSSDLDATEEAPVDKLPVAKGDVPAAAKRRPEPKESTKAGGPVLTQKAILEDPEELLIIGLDTEDGPEHPLWNERILIKLDPAKTKRLMAEGKVTQNAKATQRAPGYLGKKVIVDGRTKTRRAREVNKALKLKPSDPDYIRIPCVYVTDEADELQSSVLTENAFAEQTPMIMKAREALRLIKAFQAKDPSLTEAKAVAMIAERAMVTTQAVNQWLDVFACIPAVQKAFFDGTLPASTARRFKTLSAKEQKEQLDALLTEAKPDKDGKKKATKREVTAKLKKKGLDKATWKRLYKWGEEHKKKEIGLIGVFLGTAKPAEVGIPWFEEALAEIKEDMRKAKAKRNKKKGDGKE